MPATPKRGFDCELTVRAPEDEPFVVARAKNVKVNATAGTIDISTRLGAGWKEFIQGLKEWDVSVEELWVSDDDGLLAILDAWVDGTELYVEVRDAADEGYGFTGQCIVTNVGLDQPLDGACLFPATLKGTGVLSVHEPA
jgi:predicted secreted protein